MNTRSFKKLLIANRGEIALRIMRTCRSLGISTVAVYSDADRRSPHALKADDAVFIGPAPSLESYLNIEKIIDAARRTGAEAIHPGYGFLSENAQFASACQSSGIAFIGPSPDSIRRMGSKTVAKRLAAECGVPVVPGYDGEDQSPEALKAQAVAVGLPVLIKASAGGGGKGMRTVRSPNELAEAIQSAAREAEKSFGDGTLLIEKLIERARHVEVQILGDHYGNLIHFFERDCSLQRRHQKIVEETPSPALTSDLRSQMTEAALAVGRAIGYYSAGTVEFILAPSGEFFFIEVNTRLQVEHPVTEMVTGVDLVKLQIEIAEGKPLPFGQQDIATAGHAIEARLYAEDPANDFLPSTGRILDWGPGDPITGLRFDSGVEGGTDVGIHYDPMLAKVIAHGLDRPSALRKLTTGLRSLSIQGVTTNQSFLIRLLEHPTFVGGACDTAFIDEHTSGLLADREPGARRDAAAAVALYREEMLRNQPTRLPGVPLHFRNNRHRNPSAKLEIGGEQFEITCYETGPGTYVISCGDWQCQSRVVSCALGIMRLEIDGIQRSFRITTDSQSFLIHSGAGSFNVKSVSRYPEPARHSDQESANSPMPGQVLQILVTEGQSISVGDPLIVLEAMKMEQTLRANADGIVQAVLVKRGDVVAPGDELIRIGARPE
jgi:acetyl-CoA carboxylase biotin carboxylase subunit